MIPNDNDDDDDDDNRNIREFMIQGGDPTGTGKGGESIWGGFLPDEFHPELKVRDLSHYY